MPTKRKPEEPTETRISLKVVWTIVCLLASGLVTSVGFLFGSAWKAAKYEETLATKPFVDERVIETKRFVIEQDALVKKDAMDFANQKHGELLLKIETSNSESRAEIKGINKSLEFVVDSLRRIESDVQLKNRGKK